MSNPGEAFPGTRCDSCGEAIGKGNPIFFDEGTKLCEPCAKANNNICECGSYKKAEFKECYECSLA